MTSIWHVLLQTFQVSLIAGIVLLIKWLFRDKLSPRWQYGVWIVLLITIFVPAGYFHLYIIPRFNIYFETFKVMLEKLLDSSYIEVYEVIYNTSIFPTLNSLPQSITDYLFVIYILGMVIFILKCIYNYIRLRLTLKQGIEPNIEVLEGIKRVSDRYCLKECKVVLLKDLPSPFVFGVKKPILVLPYERVIDDKVIMHELIHLKYKDSLQSMLWSLLKSLHWFNPFLRYIFQLIHNDMESLCDQRVLELLDGEDRREYGRILLSMTNDKYPYYFGTTSISNGGKFIKQRIESIVRFKVYPKGMGIVSICIIVLLIPLCLGGTVSSVWLYSSNTRGFEYEATIASARMYYCPTMAGAIDVFARGILTHNEHYLTTVMTEEKQLDFKGEIERILNIEKDTFENERGLSEYINYSQKYRVVGLEKIDDHEYQSQLLFYGENETTDSIEVEYSYVYVPIKILKQDGWRVELNGEIIYEKSDSSIDSYALNKFPYKTYKETCENGILELDIQSHMYLPLTDIQNDSVTNDFFKDMTFDGSYRNIHVTFTNINDDYDEIGIIITELNNLEDENNIISMYNQICESNVSGSIGSDDICGEFCVYNKKLIENNSISLTANFNNEEYLEDNILRYYEIAIYIDGEIVEKFKIEVGDFYE